METLRRKKRIKTFIKQHAGFLVVLGWIIIVSTFIVKEAVRDHLRDLIYAIDRVEANLLAASRDEFSYESITALGNTGAETLNAVGRLESLQFGPKCEAERREESAWNSDPDVISGRSAPYQDSTDDCLALEDHSKQFFLDRTTDTLMIAASELSQAKELAQAIGNSAGFNSELAHYDEIVKADAACFDREQDKRSMARANCKSKADEDESGLYGFEQKLAAAAKTKRDRDQVWYDRCTWISYCLFGIGSILSLVGKFFGIDGLGL